MKYKNYNVNLFRSKYVTNNRLAIYMLSENEEPVTTITTNLADCNLTNPNCAYVDVNNNDDYLISWLEDNDIAKLTGKTGSSGFCIYPEMEFNIELLKVQKGL